jgi:hypothetical protein
MSALHVASDGFRTFCEQTTLHGWQYVVGSNDNANKLKLYFWAVIVCLSMVTAGIFLYYNTWVT